MSNVGGIDRILRIVAGLFLISLVFFGEKIIGQNVVWGWVGLIPLATGIFKILHEEMAKEYPTINDVYESYLKHMEQAHNSTITPELAHVLEKLYALKQHEDSN